jgi:hypothetical protein
MVTLRIQIDANWTAREFATFFSDIATIVVRGNEFVADLTSEERDFLVYEAPSVSKISFSSPGEVDFVGLGKAAAAIKDLVVDLVRLAIEAKDRKQLRQARMLEMQALVLDVQSKFLRNLSEIADLEQRGVITAHQSERLGEEFQRALNSIALAIGEGRITGAK